MVTKEYLIDLMEKGIIRQSLSPYWATHFFVKEEKKLIRVVDYWALNWITKRNTTPLLRTEEMYDRLGKAKYSSKLDLKTELHQIRVKPADVEKSVFNTKYVKYEFIVMPMGLSNAPTIFQ